MAAVSACDKPYLDAIEDAAKPTAKEAPAEKP
jgi:hypothetical protein